ncbi:MAG: phosphonate ABC transporter, permease protein PhnE [Bdellovibrionales bacterium]|nr:phosphonate ABC transporter, permease protein PhnE [Bdellovibrionales bacterium]
MGVSAFHFTQDDFIQNFSHYATFSLLLTGVMAIVALVANLRGWTTPGDALFASPLRKLELSARPWSRSPWLWQVVIVFTLTIVVSVRVTESSIGDLLDADGLQGAWRLWSGLSQPNFNLLPRALALAAETIFIAFLSTVLAIPAAFFLAFFAAKNLMQGPLALAVYAVLRALLNLSRSIEPLIWALIFTVWVGVGPFAGMLALTVHSIASLIKYYSEIIESVSDGPIDGIRSTGANAIQTVWYAVVPQIVLPYIAMTVYRWDTNVRMATVIGLVGGGGIGTLLIQYQGQALWPEVGCIVLVIAVIVWLMDTASAYVREALK